MPQPPICAECGQRPVDLRYRPFCSQRCKLLDLARWVDGEYRIPGERAEPESIPDRDDDSRS